MKLFSRKSSPENQKLIEQLRRDEGEKLYAYQDSLGYLTIGVGRLIDKRKGGGISPEESDMLLANDIARVRQKVDEAIFFFGKLDEARQGVLLNMAFQLGVPGLLKFHHTLCLTHSGDYTGASVEMLKSRWARQTPERARRLAEQMKTGKWQ